jgi:MFS superfamily sulfate permease-like transporter
MVDDKPPGSGHDFGGLINLSTLPSAVWKGFSVPEHQPAAMVGVVTISLIVLWTKFAPQRLKVVPAPLFAVVLATVLAVILQRFGLDPKDIQVPNTLTDAVSPLGFAGLGGIFDQSMLIAGLTLAFVASAETLLTATAVDAMQSHAPRTNYDRELVAQGIGNTLCGFLGLLPLTGVIVRSGANVQAGGRTRTATILHGVWLLLFALILPGVLRLIPVACLAAVLVFTGYKLVKIKEMRELAKWGKGELWVCGVTLLGVVVIDLLKGIMLGLGLAIAQLFYRFTHLTIRVEEDQARRRTNMFLEGAATFLLLPRIAQALQAIPDNTELHVHIEKLSHIDHACLDLLMTWEKQHEATGGTLVVDWETLTASFHQETEETASTPTATAT